jgi:hypothetical protein
LERGKDRMELEEKYPDLAFLVNIGEFSEKTFTWKTAKKTFDTKQVEVLYVYGFSPHVESLIEWVKEDPKRDLVFLEDDIYVIREILQGAGRGILKEDQVHLRFQMEGSSIEDFAASIASEFPYEALGFIDLKEKREAFEALKFELMRKSVVEVSLHKEMLHYQKLYSNLHPNFYRLSDAFDVAKWKGCFAGKPAIICGAGPSLTSAIPKIKEFGEKALIFAGGSAIVALGAKEIFPHLLFAIDPNVEEFTRLCLHTAFHVPLIYGNRVRSEIFESFSGPHGYISTGTGGLLEEWLELELGIEDPKIMKGFDQEAQSVTCLAVASAIYFGCNPILFAGVDLSYGDGERYPQGVLTKMHESLEEKFERVSEMLLEKEGKITAAKWVMERDVISRAIAAHPEHTFIDITGKGLALQGLTQVEDWTSYTNTLFDPRGKIHAQVVKTPLNISQEKIDEKLQLFNKSLERSYILLIKMIEECEKSIETPLMITLAMDLEEEIAYKLVLAASGYAYTFLLRKEHRPHEGEKGEHLIRLKLYKRLKRVVEEYQKIIHE